MKVPLNNMNEMLSVLERDVKVDIESVSLKKCEVIKLHDELEDFFDLNAYPGNIYSGI